jgi:hypothetical protein
VLRASLRRLVCRLILSRIRWLRFDRSRWAKIWAEDILVRDGTVHFWISADEPPEKGQALRVAAETIAGVRGNEEHVVPAPVIPSL